MVNFLYDKMDWGNIVLGVNIVVVVYGTMP